METSPSSISSTGWVMPSSTASTNSAGSAGSSASIGSAAGCGAGNDRGISASASSPPTAATAPATTPSCTNRMATVRTRISGDSKRANGICAILLHRRRHATGAGACLAVTIVKGLHG